MITDCQPDPERLAAVQEAMETYDIEFEGDEDDEYAEWPNNVLSVRTVVYSCGAICRAGDETEPQEHRHDEAEFALCERLANEAAQFLAGVDTVMESEEAETKISPFFLVANAGDTASALTPERIRDVFGGTLLPTTEIEVVPLTRESKWGQQIREYYMGEEPPPEVNVQLLTLQTGDEDTARATMDEWADESRAKGARWFEFSDWIAAQSELHDASFVRVLVGDEMAVYTSGCVYPRLAVALTAAGSLVGIYYNVVQTG